MAISTKNKHSHNNKIWNWSSNACCYNFLHQKHGSGLEHASILTNTKKKKEKKKSLRHHPKLMLIFTMFPSSSPYHLTVRWFSWHPPGLRWWACRRHRLRSHRCMLQLRSGLQGWWMPTTCAVHLTASGRSHLTLRKSGDARNARKGWFHLGTGATPTMPPPAASHTSTTGSMQTQGQPPFPTTLQKSIKPSRLAIAGHPPWMETLWPWWMHTMDTTTSPLDLPVRSPGAPETKTTP